MSQYPTGTEQFILAKMHKRSDKARSKVGNNTYATHQQLAEKGNVEGFPDAELWAVTIRYHETDIIMCIYTVSRVLGDCDVFYAPVSIMVNVEGHTEPSTVTRLNRFFHNNRIGYVARGLPSGSLAIYGHKSTEIQHDRILFFDRYLMHTLVGAREPVLLQPSEHEAALYRECADSPVLRYFILGNQMERIKPASPISQLC